MCFKKTSHSQDNIKIGFIYFEQKLFRSWGEIMA